MDKIDMIQAYVNDNSMLEVVAETANKLITGENALLKFLKVVTCERITSCAMAAVAIDCEIKGVKYETTEDVENRIKFLKSVFTAEESCISYMRNSVELLFNMKFDSMPPNYFPYYKEVYVVKNDTREIEDIINDLSLEKYQEEDLYPLYIYKDDKLYHTHSILNNYSKLNAEKVDNGE